MAKDPALDSRILEGLPIGIFAIGRDWRVSLWNATLAAWTGIPAGDALGRIVSEVLPALAEERYRSRLEPLMEGGPPVVFSYQLHADLFPDVRGRGPRRARYCIASSMPGASGLLFSVEDRTEIAALVREARAEVALRNDAECRLRAALAAKEMLIREASHRVKNNLAMIISLIRMEADRVASEGERFFLSGLEARIESIALIHDLLYRGEIGSEIDLDVYLQKLCDTIAGTFGSGRGGARLETSLEPVSIDLDSTLYLGMITAELMTNSLKYGTRPETVLTIRVFLRHRLDTEMLELILEDDGPGFATNHTSTSSTVHVDTPSLPLSGDSLGWKLIDMLSHELGGKAEVLSGRGARVAITIPYSKPNTQSIPKP